MTRDLSTLTTVLLLAAGIMSCSRDGELPSAETAADAQSAAQAQSQAPTASAERAPGPASGPMMQPESGPVMQRMRASCPMVVEGAKVEVNDTEDGVALTFTAEDDNLADLRQRIDHMAKMYEMHRGSGRIMWHRMGPAKGIGAGRHMGMGTGRGKGMGPGPGPMPAANVKVEQTEKGARLILTPTDSAQLEALREHTRWHAERMQSHECWMLQDAAAKAKSQ